MKFTKHEIKDLFFAGIMISLAFAILLAGDLRKVLAFDSQILILFLMAFFTAGIGFLLHELMHKYTAQKYGLFAEFRAFRGMLFLAVVFSFFGFIFAAPGAVFIFGRMNREKNGKVSLAGPMANIVLAGIFLILYLMFAEKSILNTFFNYGMYINSFLAAFNMIPVMPFDGAKVLAWNKPVYLVTLAAAIILIFASYLV